MGLFSGQYVYLLKAVSQNHLTPMRSCPEGAGLIRPWDTKEFKCFNLRYRDNVTHFEGITKKNGHYDDS